MATSKTLIALKASQLKYAAWAMGLATTGTKTELETLIRNRISNPLSFPIAPRIVSVDMGIKNLGICVLEAPHLAHTSKSTRASTQRAPLKVTEWKKIDVLSTLTSQTNPAPQQISATSSLRRSKRVRPVDQQPKLDASLFRPSLLSRTALDIAQGLLSNYEPTHILIERQRFRSGGASAVQEWTLRVNMLESMLWACFETLRHQQADQAFPAMQEVNPARVGKFWCARPESVSTIVSPGFLTANGDCSKLLGAEVTKRKVEKKDKIAVVRSWLSPTEVGKESDALLHFEDSARETANAFVQETGRGRKKDDDSAASANAKGVGKLDDLADCLLQGVAWVRWEENRRRIMDALAQSRE